MSDRLGTFRYARSLVAVGSVALCVSVIGCAATRPISETAYFPDRPNSPRVVHLKSFNALGELVPSKPGVLDVLRGKSPSPFVATPAGITVQSEHLYVCDTELGVVHDWDLASGESRRFGDAEDARLNTPVDVAVGESGVVYVADTGLESVLVFRSLDEPAIRLKPPDQESFRPVSLAVGGDTVFVADTATHKIHRFSVDTGSYQGAIGKAGSVDGEFYFPMGVAIDSSGQLWVSDMMNGRIQVFDSSGLHLLTFGQRGDRYGDLGKPKQLAVGPDGTVFIADSEFQHVHLFNSTGQLLLLVGGPQSQPGGTPMPLGTAVAPSLSCAIRAMVPDDLRVEYFFFVTNTIGAKRIGLYAVIE